MATKINKRRILVTGGAGFIGRHVMQQLGERVISFDIASSHLWDINDPLILDAVLQTVKPIGIIHLAAISNKEDVDSNPELALETNVGGTLNVLQAAKRHRIKVVVASSAATEEPQLSLYGTSKKCMDYIALLFKNVVIARLYNVYGPGSKSVVNKFVERIKERKTIKLNGNTVRDYIYVDDVASALISLIDQDGFDKVVPVGTGRGVTLNKLVSIIEKELNMDAKVIRGSAIKEIQESCCVNVAYNFYKTTLEQGIKNLL